MPPWSDPIVRMLDGGGHDDVFVAWVDNVNEVLDPFEEAATRETIAQALAVCDAAAIERGYDVITISASPDVQPEDLAQDLVQLTDTVMSGSQVLLRLNNWDWYSAPTAVTLLRTLIPLLEASRGDSVRRIVVVTSSAGTVFDVMAAYQTSSSAMERELAAGWAALSDPAYAVGEGFLLAGHPTRTGVVLNDAASGAPYDPNAPTVAFGPPPQLPPVRRPFSRRVFLSGGILALFAVGGLIAGLEVARWQRAATSVARLRGRGRGLVKATPKAGPSPTATAQPATPTATSQPTATPTPTPIPPQPHSGEVIGLITNQMLMSLPVDQVKARVNPQWVGAYLTVNGGADFTRIAQALGVGVVPIVPDPTTGDALKGMTEGQAREQGITDAQNQQTLMTQAGFPSESVVALDVPPDSFASWATILPAYISGWVQGHTANDTASATPMRPMLISSPDCLSAVSQGPTPPEYACAVNLRGTGEGSLNPVPRLSGIPGESHWHTTRRAEEYAQLILDQATPLNIVVSTNQLNPYSFGASVTPPTVVDAAAALG